MAKSPKLDKISFDKIAEAYEKNAGNLSATARKLGVDRNTLYSYRKEHPELNAMMKDAEEAMIDFSESKLFQQIDAGNLTAIIFYLKTKGKKRGYVEQVNNNVTVNPFEQVMKSLADLDSDESQNSI